MDDLRYAFIRVRGAYPHTSAVLTRILEALNVPFNDRVNHEHTNALEKTLQAVHYAQSRVPIPKTLIIGKDALEYHRELVARELSFPLVMKVDGSKGKNVWLVHTWDEVTSVISNVSTELFLFQEYFTTKYDLRVLVFYGEVLGAIKRVSSDGFYNNVSRGGTAVAYQLTPEDAQLALDAAAAVQADFGGVDLMHTSEGSKVLEVNVGPQVYGYEGAHGVSVARLLVQRLANHLKGR